MDSFITPFIQNMVYIENRELCFEPVNNTKKYLREAFDTYEKKGNQVSKAYLEAALEAEIIGRVFLIDYLKKIQKNLSFSIHDKIAFTKKVCNMSCGEILAFAVKYNPYTYAIVDNNVYAYCQLIKKNGKNSEYKAFVNIKNISEQ